MGLKRVRRGIWEGLEGRKGREKPCNCAKISKIGEKTFKVALTLRISMWKDKKIG